MPIPVFGKLLRAFRLRSGYGLREFAQLIGESPSNLSAMEMGRRSPWRSLEKLRTVAKSLALEEGSRDWDQFFLSARVKGEVPAELERLFSRELNVKLLRTVEARQLDDEQLAALIAYIREQWGKA
ncbi:MAG: helix-turn-helix domain-containing protein [Thermomicrobiales bacterium]